MSKTPDKRTTPSKSTAEKPASAAVKTAGKTASAKTASAKTTADSGKSAAPASQAAAKSPSKTAVPAPSIPAKPGAKSPVPKTVPNKPASKTASPPDDEADAKSASAQGAPTSAPPPKSGKVAQPRQSAAARASAAASSPPPVPPTTSRRFADRFAPPRPPTRQMNSLLVDITKTAQKADPKLANAWKTKAGRDMTEAEVLAMPDTEYMNEKQLDFFRSKLTRLKDDLLSNAGETTEHLREDTSIVPDPADRATIEEEHALELRTRDRERKLLKKISQSLTRLDSGEYGFCDETGEPIGLGRLIARPTATLSLEAQQRRELKQKMFGD